MDYEERGLGSEIALGIAMRIKVTFGFLILAFGLMLTDVCRLALAPAGSASVARVTRHAEKL